MIRKGAVVQDTAGRRGTVVGSSEVNPNVMLVQLDGIDYSRAGEGTPIHEARLSIVDRQVRTADLGGQRVRMLMGTYTGMEGDIEASPIMGPGSTATIRLDNGVVGEWPQPYWEVLVDASLAPAPATVAPMERVDANRMATQVEDGILGIKQAAEGDVIPGQEEAPEEMVPGQEVAPEEVQSAENTDVRDSRSIIEEAIVTLDQDLVGLFGSKIVPQIENKGLEPLDEPGSYALVLSFKDTSGEHEVSGTAIITGDTLIPPDKLFDANGREVGTWESMPELFQELPASETGLTQELEAAEGEQVSAVLQKILEKHGVQAYQKAFARYAYKAADIEKDRVHNMLSVDGAGILKAHLLSRGCEACTLYHAASLHNFQPLCGGCNREVMLVTEAECNAALRVVG